MEAGQGKLKLLLSVLPLGEVKGLLGAALASFSCSLDLKVEFTLLT